MEVVIAIAVLLISIASPFLAWWGSTRYFDGKFEERERHTQEWRERVDGQLKELTTLARLQGDVERAKSDILDLRKWKHERADPYIGALDAMNKRVERLEKA